MTSVDSVKLFCVLIVSLTEAGPTSCSKPVPPEEPVCSVFWGPMAVAILGGLIVAAVLTLLALPAMYAAWFRVGREGARRVKI